LTWTRSNSKTKPAMSTLTDAVIVNASPLLALDACNQIGLLRLLYGRVIVPDVVDRELNSGSGRPLLPSGMTAAHRAWIDLLVNSSPIKPSLLAQLDDGEASVISLAIELGMSTVLIDERAARKVAVVEGLTPIGSIGIILLAKREGLLAEVKPLLHEMHAKGIWLSRRVIDDAILRAGETP
jgi:predicted nucleic acid-binding protein